MPKLFKDDNLDSEELQINKDYANKYDNWRQKEELHKLKARYGEDVEILANSEEESSDSSEDDEGVELPEEFEKNFYKTLACLKNKDPRIYNEDVKFFSEPEKKSTDDAQSKKKKEKSLFLRDYERKIIVERGGKFSDSEDDNEEKQNKPRNPTYVQEQQEIKESFKKVLQDEDDQEKDLLFKPKTKTEEEVQKEEEAYKEWLKGQKKNISEEEVKDLKPLRDFWTDPKLDKNEKFLRDYILNKKFLDKDSANVDLDYDHIAHDSDENLSEDEKNIDKQEEFEHKYNFRFEEPDQEFIKRYPRTLENSLRKKDTRRAQKRAEVKIRKEEEKIKKKEELKQLKALKRKEIEEKIEKLKEITGNDDLQLNMMDLEEDFDPDKYDKKMSQIFNEEYYAGAEEAVKPEFPDIDEELCIEPTWDNYDPTTDEISQEEIPYHDIPHCEDPEFNMDADYDGQKNLETELVDSTKKRKRRRRNKFAEMIAKEKPKFDPTKHSSFQEYYDQYYALDYEDMIGDLPCRFKYRQVVPNDYGLTVEEILMADDKELNKWISLKKALQYKPEYQELNDVKMYKQKAANEALKRKILKSLYSPLEEETEIAAEDVSQNTETSTKKKRRRRKKSSLNEEVKTNETENTKTELKNGVSSSTAMNNGKLSEEQLTKNEKSLISKDEIEESVIENGSSSIKNNQSNGKKRKFEETLQENNESAAAEKKQKKKKKKKNDQNNLQSNETAIEKTKSSAIDKQALNLNNDTAEQSNKVINKNLPKQNIQKIKAKSKKDLSKDNGSLSKKEKRKLKFKKLKGQREKVGEVDQIASLSTERLKAYGLNPKKFKNKLKYMKKN